jgi:hypothetical protein
MVKTYCSGRGIVEYINIFAPQALSESGSPRRTAAFSANHLSFQQHSRLKRPTTFVFIHIPGSFPAFPCRSFVFSNIPASFLQKRILFLFFSDILPALSPNGPAPDTSNFTHKSGRPTS